MNIWNINPELYIEEYPGWEVIDELFIRKWEEIFALPEKDCSVIERGFHHHSYTPYKYRGTVFVRIGNRRKRIRVSKTISRVERQETTSKFWEKHNSRIQRIKGKLL